MTAHHQRHAGLLVVLVGASLLCGAAPSSSRAAERSPPSEATTPLRGSQLAHPAPSEGLTARTPPPTRRLAVAESTRLKLVALLARGDITGAITMYQTHTGRPAPDWLLSLQVAYSVTSQAIGRCQGVARVIHVAFTQLGHRPQYIAIRANEQHPYLVFDMANGKSATITRNGYHVVVRLGEQVHDAYTGPLGMKLTDYLSRLHSPTGVTWAVVTTP